MADSVSLVHLQKPEAVVADQMGIVVAGFEVLAVLMEVVEVVALLVMALRMAVLVQ